MGKWQTRLVLFLILLLVCLCYPLGPGYAETLRSNSYQFEETDLGSGGLVPSSSENYQTTLSVGDSAIGDSSSTSYQFKAGSQTTKDPTLTFSIIDASLSFGSFSRTATAYGTSRFSVIDYTSYGYAVQIYGDVPKYQNHEIDAMATTGDSELGKEQFGINLVKSENFCGSGCDLGADPDHGDFGVGSASPNYSTPNKFRYVSGETIVIGPKSSGETIYTISYIVNVTSLTPGGKYSSNQALICTATF